MEVELLHHAALEGDLEALGEDGRRGERRLDDVRHRVLHLLRLRLDAARLLQILQPVRLLDAIADGEQVLVLVLVLVVDAVDGAAGARVVEQQQRVEQQQQRRRHRRAAAHVAQRRSRNSQLLRCPTPWPALADLAGVARYT